MLIKDIRNISQVKSEIHYIKKFICNVIAEDEQQEHDFYIGFSIEYKPFGNPVVIIKYAETPTENVKKNEERIIQRLLEMDKKGQLKDTDENIFAED
jgi:hypothetical protein